MTISTQEINDLFLKELPKEFATIEHLYYQKNYNELRSSIHRLYGALCYCDFPDLKKNTQSLKQALTQNNVLEIKKKWSLFEQAVNDLLFYGIIKNTNQTPYKFS